MTRTYENWQEIFENQYGKWVENIQEDETKEADEYIEDYETVTEWGIPTTGEVTYEDLEAAIQKNNRDLDNLQELEKREVSGPYREIASLGSILGQTVEYLSREGVEDDSELGDLLNNAEQVLEFKREFINPYVDASELDYRKIIHDLSENPEALSELYRVGAEVFSDYSRELINNMSEEAIESGYLVDVEEDLDDIETDVSEIHRGVVDDGERTLIERIDSIETLVESNEFGNIDNSKVFNLGGSLSSEQINELIEAYSSEEISADETIRSLAVELGETKEEIEVYEMALQSDKEFFSRALNELEEISEELENGAIVSEEDLEDLEEAKEEADEALEEAKNRPDINLEDAREYANEDVWSN
jgi:hypothetical protein